MSNFIKNEIGTKIADETVLSQIYELVKNSEKSEYGKLIEQNASYPWIYHLAQVRSNVVEWIPVRENAAILEVNAECGAISEILFKKAKQFTFLTETKLQHDIVSLRLKKNVSGQENKEVIGYFGKFLEIEKKLETYDCIVLCGVLGYAPQMIKQQKNVATSETKQNGKPKKSAYQQLLEVLKTHLNPGGILVLADANRLGLKYLSGCQEEHFGGYFHGIHNYAGCEDGYRTFTKKEYERLLQDAGFCQVQFYYPYPDYKFASVIYSDDYLPKMGELNDNHRNIDRDRYVFFQEHTAYDTLLSEGLFQEFSNSFLILAKTLQIAAGSSQNL